MTTAAAEFGTGQVLWSMVWFFLFFIWVWLLVAVFADVFRSPDLSGGAKAFWTVFVIVLPYLGVFVYLVARGGKMHENAARLAQEQDVATRQYIQSVAGTSASPAEEISRLVNLRDKGVIDENEFQAAKGKALAGA